MMEQKHSYSNALVESYSCEQSHGEVEDEENWRKYNPDNTKDK